jgi:hypothetical protein
LTFDPEVLDALRTVSAATTCKVTGVKDLGGAGGGEGTAGVAGGVELSLTYTTKAEAAAAAAVVAAGSNTQATGGALAAYATGTQDGQKREGALVHLSAAAGIASAVPIDVANPPAVEVFEPNGQWSPGSRVTLKYTHFASAEKLDATDTQAVMAGTTAACAGSLVYDGAKWSLDTTPAGQPSEPLMNQCGGQGAALAVCDPMEAYRQVK